MQHFYRKKPDNILFTSEGFEKVKNEQMTLLEKRKTAVNNLQTAREMGDLSENGAYKAARFELTSIDRRLREFARLIRFGKVVERSNIGVVEIGSTVVVSDGTKSYTYTIVGGYESNPLEKKLSHFSPIGRALMGKKVGDTVEVHAPQGVTTYRILEIVS